MKTEDFLYKHGNNLIFIFVILFQYWWCTTPS